MELTQKACVPCQGGVPPLTSAEAQGYLDQVPGWQLSETEDRIRRRFKFGDFQAALDFVNKVGAVAEAEGHHPDITVTWGKATVKIWTHSIGGLSENDFILAARLDTLA